MTYTITLTGIAAEEAGRREVSFEMEEQVNILALKDKLQKEIPALGRYLLYFSVNGDLQNEEARVSDKDRLLVFSPYAGG